MEIELAIPYELYITLIIVSSVAAYSVVGATFGGVYYKYFSIHRRDDAELAFFIIFTWPVFAAIFFVWWTILFPARFIFNKLLGRW